MNRERLLNVARALRESPAPDDFTMQRYGNPCGTPACALGHYAARCDLQQQFRLWEDGDNRSYHLTSLGLDYESRDVIEHFDLSGWPDAEELFGPEGCGGALTAVAAAEYIERWVAAREREAS